MTGIFASIGKKISSHKAKKRLQLVQAMKSPKATKSTQRMKTTQGVKSTQRMKTPQATKSTQTMKSTQRMESTQAMKSTQALRSSQALRSNQAMTAAMRRSRTGKTSFSKTKIFASGAVAVIAALAVGVWKSGRFENFEIPWELIASHTSVTESDPVNESPRGNDGYSNAPSRAKRQAEKINMALAYVEAAMLDRRTKDAAVALASISNADPANSRIPFLMAQLSQLQLREFVDGARTAIREERLEDAANAIHGARALEIPDRTSINAVANELATARGDQRVEDVLTNAARRLEQGDLISPVNNNARYFYELVLSNDPDNVTAQQGLTIIASKLVLNARAEIDGNRFISAKYMLDDARQLDPFSDELAFATSALSDAQARSAESNRRQGEARQINSAYTEPDVVTVARLQNTGSTAPTNVADPELQALTEQLAFETALRDDRDSGQMDDLLALRPEPQPSRAQDPLGQPVSISELTRMSYVAPKYPRAAERRSLSGWVDVVFTVDTDGTTKAIEVRGSEPERTFDKAATSAVEKWKFMPVFENGMVVEKRAAVRMMFALE